MPCRTRARQAGSVRHIAHPTARRSCFVHDAAWRLTVLLCQVNFPYFSKRTSAGVTTDPQLSVSAPQTEAFSSNRNAGSRIAMPGGLRSDRRRRPQCVLMPGDIKDPRHCAAIVKKAISAFGQIDLLVNNAAHQASFSSIEDITDEEWDITFRTNIYHLRDVLPNQGGDTA
jgi:hypothetical protein